MSRAGATAALALALTLGATPVAHAFCGFFVAGADTRLVNDATMVVLMRQGARTVLSMRNDYKGPPEDFAMVVPVPVVLQQENVKTLSRALFERIDQLAAPRLVEYWEQDPCQVDRHRDRRMPMSAAPSAKRLGGIASSPDLGVTVEAQFTVGEYEVVILSAQDSGGLDTWLRNEKYKIPAGAEAALRPYVAAGSKFFVAKVDVEKVTFKDGRAQLSPLRFHYDTDAFTLPVRLGLLNSGGTQDLLVHILAPGTRYEVANYKNVTIPTNIEVFDRVRKVFGGFYAALFDRTLARNPGAVVTEYSWDASGCDPCPTPPLTGEELASLGADVLNEPATPTLAVPPPSPAVPAPAGAVPPQVAPVPPPMRRRPVRVGGGFVLTRLHARYGKRTLGDDLVFRVADPIAGGRESMGSNGKLEQGKQASGQNQFQARYIIRHPWTGRIACERPRRGIWGGPPGSQLAKPTPALDLAYAPRRSVSLPGIVRQNIPEIGIRRTPPKPKVPAPTPATPTPESPGVIKL